VVALLLENGASNNKDDKFGLTPLHEASSRNHFAIVKLLLKSGVDPFTPKTKDYPGNWCGNCPTSEGETPVEYAAKYGHIECVREFLPYLDIEGLSQAIHWAALGGKSEIIRLIVEQPDIDVNLMFDGKTPVYVASHSHDLSSMRLLLDRGASVTQKSDNYFHKDPTQGGYNHPLEYTPLHGFIQSSPDNNGRERSKDPVAGIKMLLEAGCDVNAYDTAGMTPFQECLNHCSRWDAKYTPEIVNLMLEYGADITLSSKSYHHPGQTPLHLVGRGSIQILELLIAKGADVNARCSNKGQTPIFTFIDDYTSDENLLALIKHGADCNVRDNVGNSPLHEMFKKKPAVSKLKVLLDNGADINCKNDEGKTPFHMMDSWFLGDAMPLILLAKPDLEMTTNEGLTVLLQAIKNEASIDYIRGLVNGGSKLDARDLDGRTALHLACELSDSAKIVTFLVQSSADPKAVDFSGNTLFHEIAKSSTGSIYEEKHMKLLEAIFKVGAVPVCNSVLFSHDTIC
jgi:ankyrin repeat protein